MKIASKLWLWGPLLFVLLFVGFAVMSVGSSKVDRLWLNAPDWSRAKLIADTSVRQAVPIAVDDAGGIYLATTQKDGGHQVHVLALDRQTELLWEHTFDKALDEPESLRIFWNGQSLDIFWLDDQRLYAAELDATGNLQAAPHLLSGKTTVGSFDVASGPDGSVVIWYGGTRREPGVYALPFKKLTGQTTLVDPDGLQPGARFDLSGTLHAAWSTYPAGQTKPRFYYAAYPDGVYLPEQQVLVAEPGLRIDSALLGPWLGLDQSHAYLFWMETFRSGDRANLTEVKYLSFPLGNPELAREPGGIVVPNTGELAYEPFLGGSLAAGQRYSLAFGRYPQAVSPSEIWVNAASEQELALALRAELRHLESNTVGQVGALFMQNGAPTTYQLLSFNPKFSMAPSVVSDSAGQLYYTWLERKERSGYQVYLASTAPDVRQALASLTRGDVGRMATDTFWGILRGAVFFPIAALIWLVAPLILLGATWIFRRGSDSLTSRANLISLALVLLAYWVAKLVTFASARTYVPFSGWIPVLPSWLGILLQLGVPILSMAIAFWAAWRVTERVQSKSVLLFVVVYAGIDSLLTMAVYGGLLFDAF